MQQDYTPYWVLKKKRLYPQCIFLLKGPPAFIQSNVQAYKCSTDSGSPFTRNTWVTTFAIWPKLIVYTPIVWHQNKQADDLSVIRWNATTRSSSSPEFPRRRLKVLAPAFSRRRETQRSTSPQSRQHLQCWRTASDSDPRTLLITTWICWPPVSHLANSDNFSSCVFVPSSRCHPWLNT
jgi:hypothetical protein